MTEEPEIDWSRFDMDGWVTDSCDCGHDGMGASWHLHSCEWREGSNDLPAS